MFPIIGSLALVAAMLSFKVHRMDIEKRMPEKSEFEPEERGKVLAVGTLFLLLAWFALLTAYSPIAIVNNLFPKQALVMGFSAAQLGFLLGILGVFQLGVFLIFRKVHFWYFRYSPFYFSAGLMIAGMLLLAFAKSFLMIILPFAIIGIASAIIFHMSTFYSLVVSRNKGRAGGINLSVENTGMIIMVLIAGRAINVTGEVSAGYFAGMGACLIFLLGIFAIMIVPWLRKRLADKRSG